MSVQAESTTNYEMIKAILEQSNALTHILDNDISKINSTGEAIKSSRSFHIVGIGTSYHAAKVGEHLFRELGGVTAVTAWNSFEFANIGPKLQSTDCVIVLSHRGTKKYSVDSILRGKSQNAQVILITGQDSKVDKNLLSDGSLHVLTTSRQERSSAFTISHTSAIFVLQLLALKIGNSNDKYQALQKDFPNFVDQVIKSTETKVKSLAKTLASRFQNKGTHLYLLGWGVGTWTAFEIALKIKETSYIVCEGLQIEQYLHGPFCATSDETTVLFIAPAGFGQSRTLDLVKVINHIKSHPVVLCDEGDVLFDDLVSQENLIKVPVLFKEKDSPETAISYLVVLQLLTYYIAVGLGCNPDTFRRHLPLYKDAQQYYQL